MSPNTPWRSDSHTFSPIPTNDFLTEDHFQLLNEGNPSPSAMDTPGVAQNTQPLDNTSYSMPGMVDPSLLQPQRAGSNPHVAIPSPSPPSHVLGFDSMVGGNDSFDLDANDLKDFDLSTGQQTQNLDLAYDGFDNWDPAAQNNYAHPEPAAVTYPDPNGSNQFDYDLGNNTAPQMYYGTLPPAPYPNYPPHNAQLFESWGGPTGYPGNGLTMKSIETHNPIGVAPQPIGVNVDSDDEEDHSSSKRGASRGSRLSKSPHSLISTPGSFSDSRHQVFRPERPKIPANKPFVRVNNATEGKSTRSGKLNQYDPSRFYTKPCPHPLETNNPTGDMSWTSIATGYDFEYNKHGELAEESYTRKQIRDFILNHPNTDEFKLRLWIQRVPADSARRYATHTSSTCRFRDCAARKYGYNGTIQVGHFRVAFDERWHRYREDCDPFKVAGYVHLYCMERFLDFPALCKASTVRSDVRVLQKEPKSTWFAALNPKESLCADDFLSWCKRDKLDKKMPGYPNHANYGGGAAKPHDKTLNYKINQVRQSTRSQKSKKVFEARGSQSSITVTMGDLEMHYSVKKTRKAQGLTKRKRDDGERVVDSDDEDLPPPKKRQQQDVQRSISFSLPTDAEVSEVPDTPLVPRELPQRSTRGRANYQESEAGSEDDGDALFVPEHSSGRQPPRIVTELSPVRNPQSARRSASRTPSFGGTNSPMRRSPRFNTVESNTPNNAGDFATPTDSLFDGEFDDE
ncbi:hypothetical protein K402DRAFT_456230 [Aulographum hederae CBS 113979]|uniref:Uncharacterized protein n=1 Tax=Aulographum hederae CBS 113979 TaxID=1176131 RepID=A0A6G1GTA4_9PEZI|nr:hypothetical protein K402DRAFT_456230 [Aulographum hederae CBS 113979]